MPAPIEDVIEIEQLLARYAVAMTKDDVEAVVEVFTPDGTYSAFGDTYALADFPTLVAAAIGRASCRERVYLHDALPIYRKSVV